MPIRPVEREPGKSNGIGLIARTTKRTILRSKALDSDKIASC